ncbi:MAG: 50S ribosomal protein L4 [Dehalococcoidia bacterium]|nr:50S ribosomal protein L4 [Dehalococcoidia bacterium]
MRLDVRDRAGASLTPIEVDDAVFAVTPNDAVVHQALLAQLAARRAGSANTKTRGEVTGSTKKTRRQKGLGMSRQGAIRSPLRKGGGVVFGPKPRSFEQRLPKRMRRLAIRSVLSARAQDSRLVVVDDLGIAAPSTKAVTGLLKSLGVERSALIITGAPDRNAHLSARNVDGARVLPADTLNVGDMLSHHTLLLTVDAVRRIEALWGGERAASRRAPIAQKAEA